MDAELLDTMITIRQINKIDKRIPLAVGREKKALLAKREELLSKLF